MISKHHYRHLKISSVKGVKLTRTCQSTLKEAEQRVSKLTQKDESYVLDTLNTEENN
jgi:exonuclease VII small subunit